MSITLHMSDEEYKRLIESNVLHLEDHEGKVISNGSNFKKVKHFNKNNNITLNITKEDLELLKKKNLLSTLPFKFKVLEVKVPDDKVLKVKIQELEQKLIQYAGNNSKLQRMIKEAENIRKAEVSKVKFNARKYLRDQIESEIIKKYQAEAKSEIGKIKAQIRREERRKYNELLNQHEQVKKEKSSALRKASTLKRRLQIQEVDNPEIKVEELLEKQIEPKVESPKENNKLFSSVIVVFIIIAVISFGWQEIITGGATVDDFDMDEFFTECMSNNKDSCAELYCEYAYYSKVNDIKRANTASNKLESCQP